MTAERAAIRTILILLTALSLISCQSVRELTALFDAGTAGTAGTAGGPEAGKTQTGQEAEDWDLSRLDTASTAGYLTAVEKNVVLELNKVRTDPKRYAELYLAPTLKYYYGRELRVPGRITVLTNEGRAAVEECIRVLSSTRPLEPLNPSEPLTAAAGDHVRDTGPRGIVGHTGSDGSSMVDRIRRHDSSFRGMGEAIAYGQAEARDIVVSLLVDDGVPGRGHRKIILTPAYNSAGLSIGAHAGYGVMCIIDFAQSR